MKPPVIWKIGLALRDPAKGGEGLEEFALAVNLGLGVIGDQVIGLHPAQRGRFAVINLGKALFAADGDVVGGGDGEPVLHIPSCFRFGKHKKGLLTDPVSRPLSAAKEQL